MSWFPLYSDLSIFLSIINMYDADHDWMVLGCYKWRSYSNNNYRYSSDYEYLPINNLNINKSNSKRFSYVFSRQRQQATAKFTKIWVSLFCFLAYLQQQTGLCKYRPLNNWSDFSTDNNSNKYFDHNNLGRAVMKWSFSSKALNKHIQTYLLGNLSIIHLKYIINTKNKI